MKFRLVEKVSFNKSERTNFDELLKAHPRLRLGDDEVVAFVSLSEDQIIFVYGYLALEDDDSIVLRSRRLRLTKGRWNILKLKSYARQAGMKVSDWSAFDGALAKVEVDMKKRGLKLAA